MSVCRYRPNANVAGMQGLIIHLNRYLSIRAPFGEDVDVLCHIMIPSAGSKV